MKENFDEVLGKVTDFLRTEAKTETVIGKEFILGEFTCVPVIRMGLGFGYVLREAYDEVTFPDQAYYVTLQFLPRLVRAAIFLVVASSFILFAVWKLNTSLLAAFITPAGRETVDIDDLQDDLLLRRRPQPKARGAIGLDRRAERHVVGPAGGIDGLDKWIAAVVARLHSKAVGVDHDRLVSVVVVLVRGDRLHRNARNRDCCLPRDDSALVAVHDACQVAAGVGDDLLAAVNVVGERHTTAPRIDHPDHPTLDVVLRPKGAVAERIVNLLQVVPRTSAHENSGVTAFPCGPKGPGGSTRGAAVRRAPPHSGHGWRRDIRRLRRRDHRGPRTR